MVAQNNNSIKNIIMKCQCSFFSLGNARKKAVKLSSPSLRYKEKCKFIAFTFGFSVSVNISIDREGAARRKQIFAGDIKLR